MYIIRGEGFILMRIFLCMFVINGVMVLEAVDKVQVKPANDVAKIIQSLSLQEKAELYSKLSLTGDRRQMFTINYQVKEEQAPKYNTWPRMDLAQLIRWPSWGKSQTDVQLPSFTLNEESNHQAIKEYNIEYLPAVNGNEVSINEKQGKKFIQVGMIPYQELRTLLTTELASTKHVN